MQISQIQDPINQAFPDEMLRKTTSLQRNRLTTLEIRLQERRYITVPETPERQIDSQARQVHNIEMQVSSLQLSHHLREVYRSTSDGIGCGRLRRR